MLLPLRETLLHCRTQGLNSRVECPRRFELSRAPHASREDGLEFAYFRPGELIISPPELIRMCSFPAWEKHLLRRDAEG